VRTDFTGNGSFIYWAGAIGMAGAIGYVGKLRSLSVAFMALILLMLLLKNKGFFSQFTKELQQKPVAPTKPATNEPGVGSKIGAAIGSAATGFGDWVTKLITGTAGDSIKGLTGIGGVSTNDVLGAWQTDTLN